MATVANVLPEPSMPNLIALAESTSDVLTLLRPWCTKRFKSKSLMSIKTQALHYVSAVDHSIVAAQHGYTIAEEALVFAESIEAGTIATEAVRQHYLRGMLEIARRGEENASIAWEKFRDVRETVLKLVQDATVELTQGKEKIFSLPSTLNDLQNGVSVLESFHNALSLYITWWNNLRMTHMALNRGAEIDYTSLRRKAVIQKWRELRQTYINYTNRIKEIQDSDPTFDPKFFEDKGDDPVLPTVFRTLAHFYKRNIGGTTRLFAVLGPKRDAGNTVAFSH